MSRSLKIRAVLLMCIFLGSLTAQARRFAVEDQGYRVLLRKSKIKFEANGTGVIDDELRYRVVSERGVDLLSMLQVVYAEKSETMSNIEVLVKMGSQTFSVDPKNIEEKIYSSSVPGFDDSKTIDIPVPGLKIGAEITMRTRTTVLNPALPMLNFRTRLTISAADELYYEYDVPAGTFHYLNDPQKRFRLQLNKTAGNRLRIVVSAKNLPSIASINENSNGGAPHEMAWLDLSGVKTQEEFGQLFVEGFTNVLKQTVPSDLKKLLGSPAKTAPQNEADAAKALIRVVDSINQNYRYFGDWRMVGNRWAPRNLADIVSTRYGDCKDFSILVSLAARNLGLEADPVLVFRGMDLEPVSGLPVNSVYNHALTRVKVPGAKDRYWWVDATNPISQIGIVPYDIQDRPALVMRNPVVFTAVGSDSAEMSRVTLDYEFDPSASPDLVVASRAQYENMRAWRVRLNRRGLRDTALVDTILREAGADPSAVKVISASDKLVSEYPQRVSTQLVYREANALRSAEKLVIVPTWGASDLGEITSVNAAERVSDLNLIYQVSSQQVQRLKPGSYARVVASPPACRIQSRWMDFERKVALVPVAEALDTYTLKVSRIPLADLKTKEFAELQRQLRECVTMKAFVVERR